MKCFRKNIPSMGFTLIELMITIVVIAILSGVVLQVLNPSALRAKTRDQQRIADLARIQTALELYFADNRSYPTPDGTSVPEDALSGYISALPEDPLYGTSYGYKSDGSTYCLYIPFEVTQEGNITETIQVCLASPCDMVQAPAIYCVTNP